ncbi:phosphoribosylamine--glycine ligase [Brevifollis gellanilyticus]|uniref:Phosphoribosylamine--glycine ligase n=1 Tax=Brevifollis gellanilyticus TaxID=748831 RepID=A0A512M931_9BACT|nr:phosphoribosylamine--glycine ligase [Brevifollis gellanilyticus]GEP43247.1 phosphoribosylamine--glycine ligase [Brevifollis gellanilyticus]
MKILVTGKGGREHALITALSESLEAHELFAWPGSDAIASLAKRVDAASLPELIAWMKSNAIDLCVAGEEAWLVKDEGLANMCEQAGIPCWGPYKEAAQLEASKAFAKHFLKRHNIPTASYTVCTNAEEARAALTEFPIVLKFDGLAAGKGVAVCLTREEAEEFITDVMEKRIFGAGNLVVESCLIGPELSVFASVCDDQYHILMPARDYKRIRDNDQGPNTGGMGAVASREIVTPEVLARIEREIVQPTVKGLIADGLRYRGFLYFGLMLTSSGPYIIEYNCRFGDPEAEAVMPMVRGDFANYVFQAAKGSLKPELLTFAEGWSICVISASAGYPASSRNGDVISGLGKVEGARVYHCGTKKNEAGQFATNGGRVLAVVANAATREEARAKAYAETDKINFEGMQLRSDIGQMHFD